MKKVLVILLLIGLIPGYLFSQELGKIKKGEGTRVSFNRVSLLIPEGWNYSVNPRARPGTDQLQLYSDDRQRTIQVTLTKGRDDIELFDAVKGNGFMLARRLTRAPQLKDCVIGGSGGGPEIWGRTGIVAEFSMYENGHQEEEKMHIYSFGETLSETKEVLFIVYFVSGEEKSDAVDLIETLQILE